MGDVNTGTKFEITKLSVDSGTYLVFTSEHGVYVVKEYSPGSPFAREEFSMTHHPPRFVGSLFSVAIGPD